MNEEIQADVTRFRSMLQHISATYKSIDNTSIEDYVASIEALLTDRSAIESHFTPIAFKVLAQAVSVLPVVLTSSRRSTDSGTFSSGHTASSTANASATFFMR